MTVRAWIVLFLGLLINLVEAVGRQPKLREAIFGARTNDEIDSWEPIEKTREVSLMRATFPLLARHLVKGIEENFHVDFGGESRK